LNEINDENDLNVYLNIPKVASVDDLPFIQFGANKANFRSTNDASDKGNIVCVNLNKLKDEEEVENENINLCSQCKACLSHIDKIEDNKWKCQFCGTINEIKCEIPKRETINHIIENEKKEKTDCVVYCIDTSGSMRSREYGSERSRLQLVQRTILSQIQTFKEMNPQTKICIVEFESEVTIHGDCLTEPKQINNRMLNDFDSLMDVASENIQLHNISESFDQIAQRVKNLRTKGCTALGPALLISTIIAKKYNGKVILCTDGMANQGLGSLNYVSEETIQFYDRLIEEANKGGVIINITTFKECDCNMQTLGKTTLKTNGEIIIIDPSDLKSAFDDLLKHDIIALQTYVNVFLPPQIGIEEYNNDSNKKV